MKLVRKPKCLFQGCQSVECLPQRIHLCGVLVPGSVMEPDSRTKSEREFRESVWLCKTKGNKPVECFSQGRQTHGMFSHFTRAEKHQMSVPSPWKFAIAVLSIGCVAKK